MSEDDEPGGGGRIADDGWGGTADRPGGDAAPGPAHDAAGGPDGPGDGPKIPDAVEERLEAGEPRDLYEDTDEGRPGKAEDPPEGMDDGETLAVAFHVEALERLADPAGAVGDARRWSRAVGLVWDRRDHRIVNRVREWEVYDEDFLGRTDEDGDLGDLRAGTDVDRHVLIVPDGDAVADAEGWETIGVDRAADAAEWELDADATARDE
jgi:hypothetical protein